MILISQIIFTWIEKEHKRPLSLGGFLHLDVQENDIYVMKDSGFPFRDNAADLCRNFWSLSIGSDRRSVFWSSGSVIKRLQRYVLLRKGSSN